MYFTSFLNHAFVLYCNIGIVMVYNIQEIDNNIGS